MKKTMSLLASAVCAVSLGALAEDKPIDVSCADLFPGQDIVPILAWHSIPAKYCTRKNYEDLRDAGFHINLSHTSKFEDAVAALDQCQAVGIRSIFMCSELEKNPEETVRKVMNHPGLAGYFLRDEPATDVFPSLAAWARKIISTDSKHTCYLNLFPNYVGREVIKVTYPEHVKIFADTVPIQLLSFDYYPIVNGNEVRGSWYENLEIVAKEAKRTGRPFWAFALAVAHGPYPIPTEAHLALQMYSNLAYGASCLQYFTYWTPVSSSWNFHFAPITADGKKTSVYELVKRMNAEIQSRAFVFAHSKVLSVNHAGKDIPQGTQELKTLPDGVTKLDLHDGNAVVSVLEKNGARYLMVVNRSLTKQLYMSIGFTDKVKAEGEYILRDGTKWKLAGCDDNFTVECGNCALFKL